MATQSKQISSIHPSGFDFLRKLSKNNNREWFNAHKDEYLEQLALVEGFADYVGYLGSGVPVPFVAEELGNDVHRGRVPRSLPSTSQFNGGSRTLAQAYEGGWLACRMIAAQWSQRTLVDFYASVGTSSLPPAAALAQATEAYLQLTPSQFVHRWQQFLRSQLA